MNSLNRKRVSTGPDVIAAVRAEMDRAEVNRVFAVRIAMGLAAMAIIVIAVAAFSIGGASASPDTGDESTPRAAAPNQAPVPALAVETTVAPEPKAAELLPPDPDPGPQDALTRQESKKAASRRAARETSARSAQRLEVAIGDVGYEPSVLSAKAGKPIELTVAQGEGCAAGFLIPKLGIVVDNSAGPATKKLGVLEAGDYRFTCGMGMVEGVLKVR